MKTSRAFVRVATQLADPAVITDPQGRVEWINPAFTSMCGYTLAEVRGQKPGHLLQGPDSDPAAIAELRAAIHERRSASVEMINYRKSGEPYSVWITLNPLHNRTGGLVGFMAVERETSRLQRELRRLENEIADLYAIVCHIGAGRSQIAF